MKNSKHITRNYKVKFRLCVGDPNSKKSSNFLRYYMPKWSDFMRVVMSRKLPAVSKEIGPSSVRELPELRKVVETGLKSSDLFPLLDKLDKDLSRKLVDTAPFFDSAPQDLKVHILAVFGLTAVTLSEYLSTIDDSESNKSV